jgi:hypothetical protein
MNRESTHTWRTHLGLFIAESICVSAFIVEMSRALSGNTLSWAYVVEWPVLGVYAIYMWRKLLRDDTSAPPSLAAKDEDDDPQLVAWNEYLAKVHRDDQSDQKPS